MITGELFIGSARVRTVEQFKAIGAIDGAPLPHSFSIAGAAETARACELAATAFDKFRGLKHEARAEFLEAIADEISALGDALLERASLETALPLPRLMGERARTIAQLKLFAAEIRDGSYEGIRIDPAMPERKPAPRSDIRLRKIALGPVAIFGASNFPLAFSVAGGDTASALAAGCPIVVKAHPAHPGTSEMVAAAVAAAAKRCGMPEGVFSMLAGPSNELGRALVADPRIKAVGFTGSKAGGLALMAIAAARREPIPVYAEMSSVNPSVLLPGALESRLPQLIEGFFASMTQSAGQLCTNPGIVLMLEGPQVDKFIASVSAAVGTSPAQAMLTPSIHHNYEHGVSRLSQQPRVKAHARGLEAGSPHAGRAALFSTDGNALLQDLTLAEEVFGSSSLVVRCEDLEQLVATLESFEGQLSMSIHMDSTDEAIAERLLPVMERKAGRLIVNGWPTGVEVSHAIVHGGPFPATSDGRSSSVGSLAIDRFLRPVCYQNFPDSLLPKELRQDHPRPFLHRFDGRYRAP
jgi:alpha-ketoglutaric semialdehyde dehydrogenase